MKSANATKAPGKGIARIPADQNDEDRRDCNVGESEEHIGDQMHPDHGSILHPGCLRFARRCFEVAHKESENRAGPTADRAELVTSPVTLESARRMR